MTQIKELIETNKRQAEEIRKLKNKVIEYRGDYINAQTKLNNIRMILDK